jgi:hypothetical protein
MDTRFLKGLLVSAVVAAAVGCGGNGTPSGDVTGDDAVQDASDVHHPGDTTLGDNARDDSVGPDDVETGDSTADTHEDASDAADSVQPDTGADNIEPSDTVETDTTGPDAVEQPSPHGRILLALSKWGTGDYNTNAWASVGFYDGPMRMDAFMAYTPGMYEVARQEGDCVMYKGALSACNPVCDWDEYCDSWNKCQTAPSAISAGLVRLLLGATSTDVNPTGDVSNPTYDYVDSIPGSLIHSGNNMIAMAEGHEGGFGAFQVSTTGVDAAEFGVDANGGTLDLIDGKDNVVTWTVPKGDITGLYVEMVINVGWHGSPPTVVLYCRADAAAGSFTIPQEMVEDMPSIGGMGLFQHSSHIEMARSATAVVGGKTVEFTVARRHGLNPLHNAPEYK